MPADTTTYRYSGDIKRCMQLKGLARQGVQLLGMLMSLGNLSTYQIRRVLDDGSSIKVFSSCGATYADIFGVKEKEEEEKKELAEQKEAKDLVMVYVGHPDTPFSNYSVNTLLKRSVLLWQTIPATTLAGLEEKKLLVLPWPVRGLTDDEASVINKFLSVKGNRVAVFSGEDFTSTNYVLASLNSKLRCIAKDDAGTKYYSTISGFLPLAAGRKQLFWLWARVVGKVVVDSAYWNTAVVKDWYGYGVMYDNITNMIPGTYWLQGSLSDEWMTNSKGYMYSLFLDDFEWKNDPDAWILGSYPSAYITWTYADKTEAEIIAWALANTAYMPYSKIHTEDVPTTNFLYGSYKNYSDTVSTVNSYEHSFLAYADDENIIVASFEPSFLNTDIGGISDNAMFNAFPVQLFANWLLWYDLTPSKNMFNTNNCFVLGMPYQYTVYEQGGGGWAPPIQH